MKYRTHYLLLLFSTICFHLHAPAQSFLRTEGKKIIDASGKEIILRGMGLGGWMLQEGYMYQLSFLGQQYKIREKIEACVGLEKANEFYEKWLQYNVSKSDIDALAKLGFNSIRLPMHYALFTLPTDQEPIAGKHTWLEKGFQLTDSLLQWCKQNKIYLILDLHAAPGGQGHDLPISDRDPSKPSLWESKANIDKTIALWEKLAQRYAHEPWIGGYDIINEPNWGFDDINDKRGTAEKNNIPLRDLLMNITKAIRKVDKNHIIIIEGNGFGNNYNGIFPLWDNNIVLSFHKYGNFNDLKAIQHFLDLRDTYNVPLWLGESGENSNTWFREAIKLCEDNGIGWAWWQHKKMGINNIFEVKQPINYKKLLDSWAGKIPQLSPAEAWSILEAWLENLKLGNNIFHPDVADAMFRQVSSPTAIPYKPHILHDFITIKAVDFDMGPQGVAYYDKDTASYHFTPGIHTVGNKGSAYRNDGVDIKTEGNEPFIFSIEDEEWLQYTISVTNEGQYRIGVRTRSPHDAEITVIHNNVPAAQIKIPSTTNKQWITTEGTSIRLKKGTQSIKLLATKGGFELIHFTLQKEN